MCVNGERSMKLAAEAKGGSTLDIEKDACLFRAQRGPPGSPYSRGKDLYVHERKGQTPLYYLHRWSVNAGEKESIVPISPIMAARFLEERGLVCPDLGHQRGAEILRRWGYGILEEF
jgi:hypothetical protein